MIGLVECFRQDKQTVSCTIENKETDLKYSVYYSDSPHSFNYEDYLLSSAASSFDFIAPKSDKRLYYHLVFDDGKIIHTGERILPIAGMYNYRDMGGYPTQDGRRVSWGKLYRGDYLYNLKPEGYDYLRELHIKTIIDLRSRAELASHPNIVLNEDTVSYNFDPNAHVAMMAGMVQNSSDLKSEAGFIDNLEQVNEDANAGEALMIKQQEQFVLQKSAQDAFSKTIRLVMEGEVPLYQHCRGGKDRTGFAACMELALLGVDEKYLVYDYMLTKKAREEKNKLYYKRFLETTGSEAKARYLYALFDSKEEYILKAIHTIKEKYGSFADYAKMVYSISEEDITNFRNKYLEL